MSRSDFNYIAKHVSAIPKSGIRDFFAIVQQRPEAISLGIGEPDFITPWHIREAAIFALEQGRTSYTDNLGLLSLRRELSTYVEKKFGLSYSPEKEFIVAVGVSEAVDIALRAILNPGDKVMFHQPCYVSYSPSVELAHGVAIPVDTKKDDLFALNIEDLRAAWQPGTKALMLNYPTNPTGAVFPRKVLEDIAQFAQEKDILILSDEIYAELTYEGEHLSIASLPGMRERTLFLHGFSKAWAMTGFRIGYAAGPQGWIEAMMKVHQYSMLCAPIVSQEAAIEALRNGGDSVAFMREKYQQRRDYLGRRFNEMGLDCHIPGGSFYLFPDVRSTGLSSMDFATGLLNQNEVAMVPGSAFGSAGEGFCRASYSTSYEELIEAADRIERFVNNIPASAQAVK